MTDAHHRRNVPLTVLAAALAFGTGAMDVVSFTRLGGVFSSVMTGNLIATLAMGLQSAAVRGLGTTVSTTYLTGTLTGVVASLVAKQRSRHLDHRSVAVLTAVAAGAAVGGVLIRTAPAVFPALPLATLTVVIATASIIHTAAKPHVGTP